MRDTITRFTIQCLDKKFENYHAGLGISRYESSLHVLPNPEVKLTKVDSDWYRMEQ